MTAIRWEFEAERALRAVYEGGQVCGERADRAVVATKESARDVVTEADRRIEHLIRALLEPCGHPVLGEEGGGAPFPPEGDTPMWLVDPLDGTANFATGMPWFAVSVGLWCEGSFVVGALSLPAQREIFFTHGDRGAFLNGKPLRAAGRNTSLRESLVVAGFAGAAGDPDRRARQYALFGMVNDASRGALRLGSTAANIAQVAAGRLQAAYGLGARVWDVAGALAVAAQAGCAIRFRLDQDPSRLDYIVGVPDAVAAIDELFERSGAASAINPVAEAVA